MVICDITEYWSESWGGIRRYLTEKRRYFQDRPNIRHILIVPGPCDSVEEQGGSRLYRLKGPRMPWNRSYRFLMRPWAIRKILQQENPDIIEIGSNLFVPWLVKWATQKNSHRLVSYFHSNLVDAYLKPVSTRLPNWLGDALCRWGWKYMVRLHGLGQATFVPSAAAAKDLGQHGLKNVVELPLGVDCNLFHPDKKNQGFRERLIKNGHQGPIALCVGRLDKEKAVDWLLGIAGELYKNHHVQLTLCGDGPLRSAVNEAQHSNPVVHYVGVIDNPEELAGLYASADFYLAARPYEPFGLAILEAMASGLPVVVTNGVGCARLVDESCGAYFEPYSLAGLKVGIDKVLGDRVALGKEARQKVEREFSWEKTFTSLYEHYQKLCTS